MTVENLTDNAASSVGQPLSPPLVGIHSTAAGLWSVGQPANEPPAAAPSATVST